MANCSIINPMPLTPHTIVDRYEILASIGVGGMGEVYRARDSRLNRDVAIKVLPDSYSSVPDRLRRFEQEARAAAALNHSNILAVYELGTYKGAPYLVSELLEGETLRERLENGPLPLRKVIDYGAQIARGLAAAHEKGIIHRDLKPENLFLTKDGQVKILDFGLARIVRPNDGTPAFADQPDLTDPDLVMGTVGYMSPDQVRGRLADARSDIFSLSAILHEMLTGQRAFQKSTAAETMSAILNEDPLSLAHHAPNTPIALQKIIHRGLEKNPEQRFQSASDLAFALDALSDLTLLSSQSGYQHLDKKPSKLVPALVVAAIFFLVLASFLSYLYNRPIPIPNVSNYEQLTHDGEQKSIIGTDGSRLYLSLITSAVQEVAAVENAGGELTKISMPGADMIPVGMSSDGSDFLVVEGKGVPPTGPLWSVSVLGGSSRRLGDTVATVATWSPDARQLAYSNAGDIFIAKADGTEPRKLLSMDSQVADLAWSNDGSHLRFSTSEGFGAAIGQHLEWDVAANGANLHRLLSGWHSPPDECCGRWTGDGKYFVFQSQGQIWALAKETRFSRADPQPIQLTSSPMSLHSPVPAKDGRKLFVVGRTYRGELSRYDMKSHEFAPFLNGISAEYVSFSKDGQQVAYVTYPEGILWKSKIDGSERVQLTFPPLRAVLPRWSPDGKSLVFFEFPVSSARPARIYEMPSAGGAPHVLMPDDPQNQQDPNWSPDGSKIVFAGDANDAAASQSVPLIRILDRNTGKVSSLPGSQSLFSPRWSPDGKSMAALTSNSSALELFNLQTQKWDVIARGTLGWINWSKDGEFLYVLDFMGKGAIIRVRIRDHNIEKIADLKDFITTGQFGGTLSLAPDDSPLLLRDRGTQDVYALDWNAP